MTKNNDYVLEARNIIKHYGGVIALNNVTLQLKRAELLGLVGDNGAGKSTLIKIISGALSKDSGEIYYEGKKVEIKNPEDAIAIGIETVYQDLSLVDSMDIPSNIFLGREMSTFRFVLKKRKMYSEAVNLIKKLNVNLTNLNNPMKQYSGGQRQAVAMSRAVYWGRKVALLDEPTAALGVNESARVIQLIKSLKEYGLSIVIISHNLQHIFALVDRIMVLRRGNFVGIRNVHEVDAKGIVGMITGAEQYYEKV